MLRAERFALNSDSLPGRAHGLIANSGLQSAPLSIHKLSSGWLKVYFVSRNGMR